MMRFGRACASICLSLILVVGLAGADVVTLIEQSTDKNSSVKTLLEQAKQEALSGRLDHSRNFIRTARVQQPDLFHSDLLIAQWLIDAQRVREALMLLESVAFEHEDRLDVRLAFARIAMNQNRLYEAWLHVVAAEQANAADDWSETFREQVRFSVIRLKAAIAKRRSDWESAKSLYAELWAEQQNPSDELALAKALFHLSDREAAEKHVRHACESKEIDAIAELVLASLCEQTEDLAMCEEWLRTGMQQDGDDGVKVGLELARWLIRNNRPDDALLVIESVQRLAELADEFDFVTALAYRMAGRMEEAELLLARLHQKTPSNFPISNQLALVLVESSDEARRGRALQIATSNARRFPKLEDAVSTLGWVQYRLGDVQAAEQILTATLSNGKVSRDTAYYLSQVKQALGKTEEAKALTEAAQSGAGEFFNQSNLTPESTTTSP